MNRPVLQLGSRRGKSYCLIYVTLAKLTWVIFTVSAFKFEVVENKFHFLKWNCVSHFDSDCRLRIRGQDFSYSQRKLFHFLSHLNLSNVNLMKTLDVYGIRVEMALSSCFDLHTYFCVTFSVWMKVRTSECYL